MKTFLAQVPNEVLPCLAFGHAWHYPPEWTEWGVKKATKTPYVYTIESARACSNGCSAIQKTHVRLRTSKTGNVVEVLRIRNKVTWFDPSMVLLLAATLTLPRRKDYRLELVRRQLIKAVEATGTKMRRADAAANIHVILNRQKES